MADNEEQGSARPPRTVVRPFRGPAGGSGAGSAPAAGTPPRSSPTPVAGRPAMPPFATRTLPPGATPRRPFTPIAAVPAIRDERPTPVVELAPVQAPERQDALEFESASRSGTPVSVDAVDAGQGAIGAVDDTETADVEEYEVEAYAYPALVAEASSDVIDAVVERDYATPHMGVAAFSARYPHLDAAHAAADVDDYRLAAVEAASDDDEDLDAASTEARADMAGAEAELTATDDRRSVASAMPSLDDADEVSGAAVPLWDERTSAAADDHDGGAAWHARSFADTPVTTPAIVGRTSDATESFEHVVEAADDRLADMHVPSADVNATVSSAPEALDGEAFADVDLAFDASAPVALCDADADDVEFASAHEPADASDDLGADDALDAEQDLIVAEVAAARAIEARGPLHDAPTARVGSEPPSASLAAALDRVAARVRAGELPDLRISAGASDAAILAAALSALLDARA